MGTNLSHLGRETEQLEHPKFTKPIRKWYFAGARRYVYTLQALTCERREPLLLFMDETEHKVCVFLVFSCHKFLLKCERRGKKKSLRPFENVAIQNGSAYQTGDISIFSTTKRNFSNRLFLCLPESEEEDERCGISPRGNRNRLSITSLRLWI